MVKLLRLNAVLPATGIESQEIGRVLGLQPDVELHLHQPPAGQSEVMIRPLEAFEQALLAAGWGPFEARSRATAETDALVSGLPVERRPWMLDCMSEAHLFVPSSEITRRLQALGAQEAHIAGFLDRCAKTAANTPKFILGPLGDKPRSLRDLPETPPVEALTEFFIGLQWGLAWLLSTDGETPAIDKMREWRNGRRLLVQDLERQLGCQLYHYADEDDQLDDDYVHRNLCLDYYCHMLPASPFVAFLIEATGARDVADLRTALLSPEAYMKPFALYYADGIEARLTDHFVWAPPIKPERVLGIAVGGPDAASVAASLLFPLNGGRVVIACPDRRAYDRISTAATSNNIEVLGEPGIEEQMAFLARIDVLYMVADWTDVQTWAGDADHQRPMLRLAALANSLGVPMTWFDARGATPKALRSQIEASGVLADIAHQREKAHTFTRSLKRVHLSPEWGSSGIRVDDGSSGWVAMLDHELLELPFDLIRHLVRWRDRYDAWPALQERPEGFWEAFDEEQRALEARLADALGPGVRIERLK